MVSISPEIRTQAYDLYRSGDTYTNIAQKLGLTSKNSAANIIARGRMKPENNLPYREIQAKDVVPCRTYFFSGRKKMVRERLPDTTEGVSLLDVKEDQCREIIGHWRCCGEPVSRGSYCANHAARNYA